MVPAKRENHRPSLNEVRELFNRWRQDRRRRDRIPDALWNAAASLTNAHSVNVIAKHLHLNHTDLKKRAHRADGLITFVELDAVPFECTVEMEKPTGERMRITGGCDVIELARIFLA